MDLLSKRLILVMGKGGVGRTAVASAIALAAARSGKRTLLYQTKSRERLSRYLAGPVVGEEITSIRDHLWAVSTNPRATLREYGLMVLKVRAVYNAVMDNKVVRYFLRAVPGLEDYSLLGKAWFHTTEMQGGRPKWDVVVFDGPATGHFLTMLRIPQVILDTVPPGPLTRDAKTLLELLRDPARTAPVLVTLPEELPVNETIELSAKMRSMLKMEPAVLMVNGLLSARTETADIQTVLSRARGETSGTLPSGLAELCTAGSLESDRHRLQAQHEARLTEQLKLPRLDIPLMRTKRFGVSEIEKMAELVANFAKSSSQ